MTVLLLLDVYTELVIDVFYIFNSTVIDRTCYIFFLVFIKHYMLLRHIRAGNIMVILNVFHSVVLSKVYLHNTVINNCFI